MWVTSSLATALTPTVVALGNFDGIHRGHECVIRPILQAAKTKQSASGIGYGEFEPNRSDSLNSDNLRESFADPRELGVESTYATVATFNPHPREFFSGVASKLLTPRSEKVQQLSILGVQQLVLLPFDRELASLSPEQFVEKILVQQLDVRHVSVGEDFRFGHKRSGTSTDLQALASAYGIEVTVVSLKTSRTERISSSVIRQSLELGDISKANRLLGRSYSLTGTVVKGQQLGRTIGFPTANLQLCPEKFLPRKGVYCVRVWGSDFRSAISPQSGVMNIGERPTINGTCLTVEVHLLDGSPDLYGQTLTVSLEEFLRPEQKFDSLDALKRQIQADCARARAFLSNQN